LAAKTTNAKRPLAAPAVAGAPLEVPFEPVRPVGRLVGMWMLGIDIEGIDIDGKPPPPPVVLVPTKVGTVTFVLVPAPPAAGVVEVVVPPPPPPPVLPPVPVSLTPLQSGLPEASTEQVSPAGQQKL